jgi:hypothetical protein
LAFGLSCLFAVKPSDDPYANVERAYAVVRAEPSSDDTAAVALGISAPEEICRVTAEFSAADSDEYRTIDLGSHALADGAKIWVRANGTDPRGKVQTVFVNRFFSLLLMPLH